MARRLGEYQAYLFDVDGTLVRPGEALPGIPAAIHALRRAGKTVRFVTNNSNYPQAEVAARFRSFGLPADEGDVFSALTGAVTLIRAERPGARVHVFGSDGLRGELRRAGLTVTDGEDAQYVVAGYNPGVSLENIGRAMRTVLAGAKLIAVNRDRRYMGHEELVPGAGVFVAMLETATGRPADVVVGKPSPAIIQEAMASIGCAPADCLIVGDNLESDMAAAHAAGVDSLMVLTGVSQERDIAATTFAPTHLLTSVAELPNHL
ncbi:MAG: HAD-IIA family hydrolase [Chloroflexota bacterium]